MLSWNIIFLVLAVFAGVLGFTAVAGASAGIGKVLFVVFVVLLLISAIGGAPRGNSH
jgi:uncharacterized membrane protein YtjA (UPF0391 family)